MNKAHTVFSSSKIRTVLKIITFTAFAILMLLIVSWFVMVYFPTTNFQQWFFETRYAWLGWRFVLYGVIWLMMTLINKKRQLPPKARMLILLVIPAIEGINLMYLL